MVFRYLFNFIGNYAAIFIISSIIYILAGGQIHLLSHGTALVISGQGFVLFYYFARLKVPTDANGEWTEEAYLRIQKVVAKIGLILGICFLCLSSIKALQHMNDAENKMGILIATAILQLHMGLIHYLAAWITKAPSPLKEKPTNNEGLRKFIDGYLHFSAVGMTIFILAFTIGFAYDAFFKKPSDPLKWEAKDAAYGIIKSEQEKYIRKNCKSMPDPLYQARLKELEAQELTRLQSLPSGTKNGK